MSESDTIRRDARDRAVDAIEAAGSGQAFVGQLLDAWQQKTPLSPADAGLAAELAIGTIRRLITCEHIAASFYRGRWAGLRDRLRAVLAMAIYQLCWLDRIPDHAAIDQGVRQAKKMGVGAAKIANAVLRQVQKHRGETTARTEDFNARTTLLLDAVRQVEFTTNIFPDPAKKSLLYFQTAYGIPPFLVERWNRKFKLAGCRQICESTIRRAGLTLRPNALKLTAAELLKRITDRGIEALLSTDSASILLPSDVSAADIPEIAEGLCQPQDETAQKTLRNAGIKPGTFVIDYCAGVGTKSTQAAELMNNEGVVIATDIDERKLERVRNAADAHGIHIIETCRIERVADLVEETGRTPDVIVIDAPCLNTGVLAKRPEARYRASQQALNEITQLQSEILRSAAALAGPATRLVYATCSLEDEENRAQVDAFVETNPTWTITRDELTLPDQSHDGGYWAVLERTP
ncbi:MAG: methyltransferase domain-containing protein [Phycisphaerales bacterium]|nr:methyltransferase domain-containing protein [Phycisphaerales bacterium]MCB9857249.1 methyltransferase domain-containing protein [Phycisphaerales bacterium]MCB9863037.1 methyltransferase domain-containing protein [Phycisphaerales bacterium]